MKIVRTVCLAGAAALTLLGCSAGTTPGVGASSGTVTSGAATQPTSGTTSATGGTSGTVTAQSGTAPSAGVSSGGVATSGTAAGGGTASGSGSVTSGAGTSTGASGAGVSSGDMDAGVSSTGAASGVASGSASGSVTGSPSDGGAFIADGGKTPTVPSTGCGQAPKQAFGKYVNYQINVTQGLAAKYTAMYTARNYYVWLPSTYDPTKPYTTVFLGPGCGGNGSQVLPMQNASKDSAILVGLSPVGQCFMTSAADSPEIAFFDAVLSDVESSFCVDKGHVFIAGFSSGSWLSNLIGCARAGIVRGQGNATGGLPPVPMCAGPIAAMLAHDVADPANNISGGEAARDRILKINGCSLTDTVPYDAGRPSMCVSYQGCPAAYPVVWCPTTGQGHSDQVTTGLSVPGFWNFWEALP